MSLGAPSTIGKVQAVSLPGIYFDIFGRLNVGNPETLFDSKQLFDNKPHYWDDQQVSGTGTTSTYTKARASTTLEVALNTVGRRVRQTFQRMDYQPGKAQVIELTGTLVLSGGGAGIDAGMGYCDDDNGVFVQALNGNIGFGIRSSVTGSPVDDRIEQAGWNGDKLDGSGASGFTLDASKTQLWWCDLTWLGVGPVRMGFIIEDRRIVCHTFDAHSNVLSSVYMSTPNLPVRYWIENDGSGAASTLEHICSTVISNGGQQDHGENHWADTDGEHTAAALVNTKYAVMGIRLRASHIGMTVKMQKVSVLSKTSDNLVWTLEHNPTVSPALVYADYNESGVQLGPAITATPSTVTGGHIVGGGHVAASKDGGAGGEELDNALKLGSAIDGTVDELVLCVRSFGANAEVEGGLQWKELS